MAQPKLGRPRLNGATTVRNFTLPTPLYKKLVSEAKSRGMMVSQLLIHLLHDALHR